PKDWVDGDIEHPEPAKEPANAGEVGTAVPADWAPTEPEPDEHTRDREPSPSGENDRGAFAESSSLAPQRYKVQFTATQEYVAPLEQALDLVAHAVPDRAIEEVHLRAMRVLVAELKKRKFGTMKKPRWTSPSDGAEVQPPPKPARDRGERKHTESDPRQRGRYVPVATKRTVADRDSERCAYVDDRGERCRETSRLEFHHDEAFALSGPPTVSN